MSKILLATMAMASALHGQNTAMADKAQAVLGFNGKYSNFRSGSTNNTGAMQTAKNAIKSRNKARRAQNKARKINRK